MNNLLIGIASYYSIAGCLGCPAYFDQNGKYYLMNNGERFDDTKLTLALTPKEYRKYKNKFVRVTNLKNKKSVVAKVTDSGGFGKYHRVADLSLATKNAILCSDLCKVQIE